MTDYEARILGLSQEQKSNIEISAERLRLSYVPDGKYQYIPESVEYSQRNLISKKTIRRLQDGE